MRSLAGIASVFNGKTVLLTGHTGFKGSWFSLWLSRLGARVVGVARDLTSEPSNFVASSVESCVEDHRCDIRDVERLRELFERTQPDFVFHVAAQALVRIAYEMPLETFSTNAIGTSCVLEALRTYSGRVVAVMVTSDKAYDNIELIWGYRETDQLGGKDPYSASKAMAELAIRSYVESFFAGPDANVRIGVARAGNVIGGGDWARDRIVPDCMRAWSRGEAVDIRSPDSTRPWQHVLEPLSGYLALAASLSRSPKRHGEAYNFGPPTDHDYTVRELIEEMQRHWDDVRWNDVSGEHGGVHESALLKLNCDKARRHLGWTPTLRFEETIRMTVEWYKTFYRSDVQSMRDLSEAQIDRYMHLYEDRHKALRHDD